MITVGQFEKEFYSALSSTYDDNELKNLYQIFMEDLLGLKKIDLALSKQVFLTEYNFTKLKKALAKLTSGIPIQYIIGKAFFYGQTFHVTPDTLIPRPETEELVDKIIKDLSSTSLPFPKVIDIGTGSGCIALSVKKKFANVDMYALDISKKALLIAHQNAKEMALDIHLLHADIFEWEYLFQDNKFDIIVSNPPYIREMEKEYMDSHVLDHEPHSALFVPDESPLIFYSTIADFAVNHLSTGGYLYFEINQYLASDLLKLLQSKGFYHTQLIQDINGADRFIIAQR